MKITETVYSEALQAENHDQQSYSIAVDGVEQITAQDGGEPEDNMLGRDLNFVYDIVGLMKRAYDAGKKGEEFEVTTTELTNLDS